MITRTATVDKMEYVSGTVITVTFNAIINDPASIENGNDIYCGSVPFKDLNEAGKAAADWMNTPHDIDSMAIKLTESTWDFDPYCGADYGEVLKAVSDNLQTVDGCRFLLDQTADMLKEACA